jgi:hypothetical protein
MFSPATAAAAGDSVVAVERAIEMWNTGAQPPFEEWRSELALTLDVAEESRLDFRRLALDEVAAVAERAVPETDAHEPGTRAGVTAAEG